jgi:rifampicin phosphotransferase
VEIPITHREFLLAASALPPHARRAARAGGAAAYRGRDEQYSSSVEFFAEPVYRAPMASEDFVVELKTLDAQALPRVGGKAANLGELIGAGFPVPPGFAVTTAAYVRAATALDLTDPQRAREALASAELPAGVAEAVRAAYLGLGVEVPVAVRSSATAEDLPWASFAGQQDTYLNVVGVDALLDAVRRCWASLWTERAVTYRAELGLDDAEVRLAVVVQRMVDAQVAGVLFTADPVSGRRTRSVLDASPGLGEAVVSGMVNPDHLAVEDDRVVDRRLGDKAVASRRTSGRRRTSNGPSTPTASSG